MAELTNPKKEMFANLLISGMSKKDAATKAGYSAKTAGASGSRLSRDPEVVERVRELKGDLLEDLGFDKLFVTSKLKKAINHLEELGYSSKDDFNKINATTQLIKTLKEFHLLFHDNELETTDETVNLANYTGAELDAMIKKYGGK